LLNILLSDPGMIDEIATDAWCAIFLREIEAGSFRLRRAFVRLIMAISHISDKSMVNDTFIDIVIQMMEDSRGETLEILLFDLYNLFTTDKHWIRTTFSDRGGIDALFALMDEEEGGELPAKIFDAFFNSSRESGVVEGLDEEDF
jgi:hypothetical protein